MLKRMVLGLLFILLPGVAVAQGVQESYLPAKSQLYFRWDGMATHQAAFDKSAVGIMMKGDTGKFLDELWTYTHENLKNAAQLEPKIEPMLKDFTKLVGTMHSNGLVLAVEAEKVNPPMVQAVIVFPKAAGESGTVMPLITRIAEEAKAEIKTVKVGKRFVNSVNVQLLNIGWWGQGNDAILFLGTTDPVAYAKLIDAKETGIVGNPLYKKVIAFKEFPTASRGFIDVAGALNVAAEIAPPAGAIIDELGLKGLKSITFMSGFDGLAERSVVDVDMPSPRKGLLSLTSQKKISMKDLPALPADITGFSAGSIALNKSYGEIVNLADGIIRIFDANKADDVKEAIKAFEGAVGVDINKDLFGSFGDVMVSYGSPSEPGGVLAIQAKDGKKLVTTLDKLLNGIPANPLGQFVFEKKPYRGGEIVRAKLAGDFVNQSTYIGIYKDWIILASYPQSIKGFIMRQEGILPTWKADPALTKVLKQFPSEFTSIMVSDPRPTVKTVLAAAPMVFDLVNTFGTLGAKAAGQFGGAGFEYRPLNIELIPHAEEATLNLFPNVTIGTDDGKRVRTESRSSLALPF